MREGFHNTCHCYHHQHHQTLAGMTVRFSFQISVGLRPKPKLHQQEMFFAAKCSSTWAGESATGSVQNKKKTQWSEGGSFGPESQIQFPSILKDWSNFLLSWPTQTRLYSCGPNFWSGTRSDMQQKCACALCTVQWIIRLSQIDSKNMQSVALFGSIRAPFCGAPQ